MLHISLALIFLTKNKLSNIFAVNVENKMQQVNVTQLANCILLHRPTFFKSATATVPSCKSTNKNFIDI